MDLLSTPEELVLKQVLHDYSYLDVTPDVVKKNSTQVGGGGFSDVFHSKMRRGWQPRPDPHIRSLLNLKKTSKPASASITRSKFWKNSDEVVVAVAIKRLRFWGRPIPKIEKAIAKEIKIWAKLSHPNILPILGYVLHWTGTIYPSLVSPWIENGTLREYMKRNNVDVYVVAEGIASGLQYLHSQNVVHGDLKCDNVMLSTTLKPLLTDFGLSRQIIASVSESTTTSGGSLRWNAPELVDEGEGKVNKRSDVWALGMTIVELLTKNVPYKGMSDVQVVRSLVNGTLPAPPDDLPQRPLLDQQLWSLFQGCWAIDSSMRPMACEVRDRIRQILTPESITQITQITHLYPDLNLTDVMKPIDDSGQHFIIPPSHFTSPPYRENRPNVTVGFQNLWGEIDPNRATDATPDFVKVLARRGWPEFTQPKPNVIAKEIGTLVELSHVNILPLLGYLFESDEWFSFIFPEVDMTLHNYMYPNDIDILSLTKGIASGLEYLHSNHVVCSTLNGLNIGLSPTCQPLIEVSMLWLSQPDSSVPQKQYKEMTWVYCEWMAVEIFDDRCIGHTTKETDVWAFGMTVLELFTKDYPYGGHTPEIDVIQNLKNHRLPSPPNDIANRSKAEQELWALVQECWDFEPSKRPTAQYLHEKIQEIIETETLPLSQVFQMIDSPTSITGSDFLSDTQSDADLESESASSNMSSISSISLSSLDYVSDSAA